MCVASLRTAINARGRVRRGHQWHNLVFVSGGPCVLIHVEDTPVSCSVSGAASGSHTSTRASKPSGEMSFGNLVITPDTPIDPLDRHAPRESRPSRSMQNSAIPPRLRMSGEALNRRSSSKAYDRHAQNPVHRPRLRRPHARFGGACRDHDDVQVAELRLLRQMGRACREAWLHREDDSDRGHGAR